MHAVLLDTVSIQKYVFQSNQLKENLGASFLVEEIYRNCSKNNELFEVGYIGGGNALLLFQEEAKAKEFIREWTTSLLINAPGIVTAVALDDKFDLDNFTESRNNLFKQLWENKLKYVPETVIPRHGITAECSHSGLSMDVWNAIEKEYVSAGSNAKIEAAEKAQNEIHKKYKEILKDEFCFTNELDKLGGISGEDSHIAIVHIDGNNMAERFKAMYPLEKIRELSKTVNEATESAFSDLLTHIVKRFDDIMESLGFDKSDYPKDNGKCILPIRPIVLGGDDITFVCDGKLGIYFAKIFIEAFEKKSVSAGGKLTACAGVAIIKTKYPFYRGYQLAEEICRNAKQKRRKNGDSYSYLDFHISMGGLAGSLEHIRKKYFKVPQGDLLYRPYKIVDSQKNNNSFDLFVKNTGELKKNFPKNKIHELRRVLTLSGEATDQFIAEMKNRKKEFPKMPGHKSQTLLFQEKDEKTEHDEMNSYTPYFDMIELMKFYPDFELNGKETANENLSA